MGKFILRKDYTYSFSTANAVKIRIIYSVMMVRRPDGSDVSTLLIWHGIVLQFLSGISRVLSF